MSGLTPIAENLWAAETVFRSTGVPLRTRMTVVRLEDGGLWLHAPARPDEALVAAVAALGPVTEIIAPNRLHHLFTDAWRERFPAARLHAAPGLSRKRPQLAVDAVLGDAPDPAWQGEIDQVFLDGQPVLAETAFLHRPTRSLILTDLLSNVGSEAPAALRLWMRANGAYGRLASTRMVRWTTRRRALLAVKLRRVLDWDFHRLIVAHGRIVERDARDAARRALAWVFD